MQPTQSLTSPTFKTLRILWVVIFAACLGIGFAGLQIKGEPVFEGVAPPPVSLAIAFIALVLSFVFPLFLLKLARSKLPEHCSFEDLVKAYFLPFVIRLALTESVAIAGLLATMWSDFNITIPFVGTAVFRLIIAFPTEEKIRDVFSKFE